MDDQRQGGCRLEADFAVVALDKDACGVARPVRRSEAGQHPVQRLARVGRRLRTVRPDIVVRPGQRRDAFTHDAGKGLRFGMIARRERDDRGDDREQVLDPVRQLVRNELARFLGLLELVDVGAGAEPAGDRAVAIGVAAG